MWFVQGATAREKSETFWNHLPVRRHRPARVLQLVAPPQRRGRVATAGAERWAITYRLGDGHVTGIVFRTDGGPSSFLDCDRTSVTDTDATFDCYGADACGAAPCPESQYTLIASDISLPLSFFFPPGTDRMAPAPSPT